MARRIAPGQTLVLASHNRGKLREITALLRPHSVELVSAGALGLPEPAETAPDFAGNARIKALAAAEGSGLPALSDDSGFCVAALGGQPGVFSARWAGQAKDFDVAMGMVKDRLGDRRDRRAWFIAALCLAWPDGHTETFLGRIDGAVTWPPRGAKGFGYDPIFVPAGDHQTFGEMEPDQKHAISHRARAFAQVLASCFAGRPDPHP
ncbi:non-canonical purine NTP pyrophosphatase [Rhodopila globiformis]|uniref:dITP/XTP pyrophosphatase n=1 Tax=Rhodopila globiformis TaxID=1071 RepID=A0A2S6MVB1_RHOGL|nr:non-canonical purine NTP pyrophosphatase [Rhodopila globiformis]PPQ26292.1 non-canonical purine NTP pyrophosphatase [Rhodopila globiformis]